MTTDIAEVNELANFAQWEDDAVDKDSEKVEEGNLFQEGKVEDANERVENAGNYTPSLEKDIPYWYRAQFEDEVVDAVNEADGYVKSQNQDRVVVLRWQKNWSVFYKSH